jgi:DNA-binding winged helix-turn-helix (wHTH) protein
METLAGAKSVRFGPFALDLRTQRLTHAGVRVRLQGQAFQVLAELVLRRGELVTREELEKKLWPGDTFVDFESGLNTAVKRLREALGDSAEKPRYIETLPRLGYRFVGEVEVVGVENSSSYPSLPAPASKLPPQQASSLGTPVLAGDPVREGWGTRDAVVEKQIPPLRDSVAPVGMTDVGAERARRVRWWWIAAGCVTIATVAVSLVAWRRAHTAPAIHSIAVLPFTNLSMA